MTNIVCPNCNAVTPSLSNCIACNAFIGGLVEQRDLRPVNQPSFWQRLVSFLGRLFGSEDVSEWNDGPVDIDPHLLRHCARNSEQGIHHLTCSPGQEELAVIAKVTNLSEFKREPGVRVVTAIGPTTDDPTYLVTARITAGEADVRRLACIDNVKTLKAVRRVRPFLEHTRDDVFEPRAVTRSVAASNDGRGVIIGIVDFGLDLIHRNLRNADGSTRVLAVWDQAGSPRDDSDRHPYGYGRLISKATTDRILTSPSLLEDGDYYTLLGYRPSPDSVFDSGSHGTYVADIATGNGNGSSCSGIAPDADIVFVDLSTSDTPLQDPRAVGNTFGDSIHLLEAVKFIFDYAGDRPCVVNLSVGTNGGPHNGSTPVEEALDRLVREQANRAVVVAAGNSFEERIHAMGRVDQDKTVDLGWRIPRFDSTSNELEVWYPREDEFDVDILDPDGELVMSAKPGKRQIKCDDKHGLLILVNRKGDRSTRLNSINVFFERTLRDGVWTVRLKGQQVKNGRFHAWIERDERGQSRFVESVDEQYLVGGDYTLGSIACGKDTIVVGSYDAHDSDLQLADSSSSGPTADGREKPELSAPGEGVLAAQSGTGVLRHRQSGTSLAAAVVSGTVALMLAEAHDPDGPKPPMDLDIDQIRKILIRTARPATSEPWDPRFGYGRVSAAEAVKQVAELRRGKSQSARGD